MWKTGSKTGAQAVVSITPTLSKYKTYLLFAIIQNVTNDSIKTINKNRILINMSKNNFVK
jgi:hypothetical protein